jgi:chaperone required for assembly of F1-ATPase
MKRFYKDVTIAAEDGGWRVLLDGRGIRTALGADQRVPTRALAEELAAEWASQDAEINTAAFVFRDLADYAIDIAGPNRDDVIAGVLRFAETDTLCYRADAGEPLHARQLEVWEPLLSAAEARWAVHFERIDGIIHHPQPPETLHRIKSALAAQDDFSLAALNTMASLAASLVTALAALSPAANTAELWDVANLEEDWQAQLWGWEAEAAERREQRRQLFDAAARFATLAQPR